MSGKNLDIGSTDSMFKTKSTKDACARSANAARQRRDSRARSARSVSRRVVGLLEMSPVRTHESDRGLRRLSAVRGKLSLVLVGRAGLSARRSQAEHAQVASRRRHRQVASKIPGLRVHSKASSTRGPLIYLFYSIIFLKSI